MGPRSLGMFHNQALLWRRREKLRLFNPLPADFGLSGPKDLILTEINKFCQKDTFFGNFLDRTLWMR